MRTLLCLCLIPAIGFSADPPVKQNVKVAWAWASANVEESCPGPNCKVSAAWLWCTLHPEDLPEKEAGCHCGPDCGCGKGCECKCTQAECYEKLRSRAIRENKPLVVGVGCEPPRVDGALSCRHDRLAGFKDAIVVSKPNGKELYLVTTLPRKVSADTITATLNPKPLPLPASAAR